MQGRVGLGWLPIEMVYPSADVYPIPIPVLTGPDVWYVTAFTR